MLPAFCALVGMTPFKFYQELWILKTAVFMGYRVSFFALCYFSRFDKTPICDK